MIHQRSDLNTWHLFYEQYAILIHFRCVLLCIADVVVDP